MVKSTLEILSKSTRFFKWMFNYKFILIKPTSSLTRFPKHSNAQYHPTYNDGRDSRSTVEQAYAL